MPRKPFYTPGSRVPYNAKVDKKKKELIEKNIRLFGVKSLTEWIDQKMDQDIKAKNLKKKEEK